jgi:acyl-homoserine-lactone acylase
MWARQCGKSGHRWGRSFAAVVVPLLLVTAFAPPAAEARAQTTGQDGGVRYQADIRRTAHGIPHIRAADYGSLGFGYGYASAEDNVCVMAEEFVTLAGERSRFFGPNGSYVALGQPVNNLDSDFFYRSLAQSRVVERLLAGGPRGNPPGPSAQARDLAAGYAAGYDRFLRDRAGTGLSDPRCRGASWVRPIGAIDVWRRLYRVATLLGSSGLIRFIATAQPPTTPTTRADAAAHAARRASDLLPNGATTAPGSNAYGLGGAATVNGRARCWPTRISPGTDRNVSTNHSSRSRARSTCSARG